MQNLHMGPGLWVATPSTLHGHGMGVADVDALVVQVVSSLLTTGLLLQDL